MVAHAFNPSLAYRESSRTTKEKSCLREVLKLSSINIKASARTHNPYS